MCVCVFSYLAVHVIVAHPAGWDARRVAALELAGPAGGRRAFHLVRAVATVVLAVAHEVAGDAAATGTRELVRGAGDVTWEVENVKGLTEAPTGIWWLSFHFMSLRELVLVQPWHVA